MVSIYHETALSIFGIFFNVYTLLCTVYLYQGPKVKNGDYNQCTQELTTLELRRGLFNVLTIYKLPTRDLLKLLKDTNSCNLLISIISRTRTMKRDVNVRKWTLFTNRSADSSNYLLWYTQCKLL